MVVGHGLKDFMTLEPQSEVGFGQQAEESGPESRVDHHVAEHVYVHLSQELERI